MLEGLSHVSVLAVIAASAAQFVLGGVWYTVLFGKAYAAALGIADRPPQKPSPLMIGGPFVCSLFTITTTAALLRALAVTTFPEAVMVGAVVGVGYLAPMTMNIAINPLFPRPFRYALINAPMFIGGSVIASVVITAIQ